MVASGIPPGGTTKLRLVFLRATDPPLPAGGPHMLGTLTLVRGAGAAAVSITGVNALGADFATQAIVPKLIAVPEPGPWLLLTSGLLGLAGLDRWRRRD